MPEIILSRLTCSYLPQRNLKNSVSRQLFGAKSTWPPSDGTGYSPFHCKLGALSKPCPWCNKRDVSIFFGLCLVYNMNSDPVRYGTAAAIALRSLISFTSSITNIFFIFDAFTTHGKLVVLHTPFLQDLQGRNMPFLPESGYQRERPL